MSKMTFDEWALRQMLCLRHGCGSVHLYLDDGELQCKACGIDFLRDSVDDIMSRFRKNGALQMLAQGVYFETALGKIEVKTKPPDLKVADIVDHWLRINGYDGLWHADGECACKVGKLDPGDCLTATCQPGYLLPCPETCGEHEFHIGKKKQPV
jgi:hypothetical protein